MLREVVALVAGTSAIINGIGVIGAVLSLVTAPPDALALVQLCISLPVQLITALTAASAWRLRLEPRIELLRDCRNGTIVVSLLNIVHWLLASIRHRSSNFLTHMLPALLPELLLAFIVLRRPLAFAAESLVITALDLELFTLCECLATIASLHSADLRRGFSDLTLLVSIAQLLGAALLFALCLSPLQLLRDSRLLRLMCNACLILGCISLLTSSAHMSHISAALLFAAALSVHKQENPNPAPS